MNEHSPLIDRTIDDVARAMTSAEGIDLRAAVLPRLAPRRSSPLRWIVPAAAVASIVIVAIVTRHNTASVTAPGGEPVERVASNAASAAAPSVVSAPNAAIVSDARSTSAASQPKPFSLPEVSPLEPVSAIPVTSIQPTAAAIPQLVVAPIDATAPIALPEIGRDR